MRDGGVDGRADQVVSRDAAVGGHPHAEGEHQGEDWVLEQVRVEKVGEQPEEQHPCADQSRVELLAR